MVSDFGLAKIDATAAGLATLRARDASTQAGEFVGSKHYASPEQIKNAKAADRRSDLYSVGVLLYEAVMGHPPSGDFVAPSEKAPVHEMTDYLIRRALAPEPGRRYQDAAELRKGLDVLNWVAYEDAQPESGLSKEEFDRVIARENVKRMRAQGHTFVWQPRLSVALAHYADGKLDLSAQRPDSADRMVWVAMGEAFLWGLCALYQPGDGAKVLGALACIAAFVVFGLGAQALDEIRASKETRITSSGADRPRPPLTGNVWVLAWMVAALAQLIVAAVVARWLYLHAM